MIPFKCSVCGDPAVSSGHGDGDLLCEVCNDWRQESVDAERQKRQVVMSSTEWIAKWMEGMAGYGEAPPVPNELR